MIAQEFAKRNLPAVLPAGMTAENFPAWKKDMVALYEKECFGVTPAAPKEVRAKIVDTAVNECAGKAVHHEVLLSFDMEKGEMTFPAHVVLPKTGKPMPCALYISFSPYATEGYQPIEEIVDNGFAYAMFNYEDVTRDNGDMTDGMAALTSRDSADAWGKIGMWAYAASRLMDYLETLPEIDKERVVVIGHSRLGKTALWASAQDERFAGVVSNESGCSGAAVSRGKVGESIARICSVFPFWFCENYQKYAGNEDKLPFEQYHLLACSAPRNVYVASAIEDTWADPASEFLSTALLHDVYALFGYEGLGEEPAMPAPGHRVVGDKVGYHCRFGTHYFSRYDWVRALQFMRYRV